MPTSESSTDAAWLARVQKITDPIELLAALVELDEHLSGVGDPYYRDLYQAVIDRASALRDGEATGDKTVADAARRYVWALDAPEPPDDDLDNYYETGPTSDEYLDKLKRAVSNEMTKAVDDVRALRS